MSIFDKLRFINETISVNGQPLNDDDTVEEVSPDYTGDNPEDEPSKDPNRDAPPKTPDPPTPAENTPPTDNPPEGGDGTSATPENDTATPPEGEEDDAPDYTADSPEGGGDEETPNAGEPVATANDAVPEGDTGNEGTPEGGDIPAPTAGEDDAPDYTADSPEGDGNEDTPTGDGKGGDDAPDYTADSPEGGDEENPEAGNGEGAEDDAPDYTEDSPEGGDEGEEGTNDSEVADAGEDDEIDQLQKDVFADMTPAQIAIKDKEQKTQFITLFSDIASALERLNLVGRSSANMRTIEFVTRKFIELKDNVKDYLVYTYDNESYTKNTYNLNRFIAIYASLIELIENMVEEKKKLEGETSKTESAFQEFFGFAKDLNHDIGTKYRYAGIIHSIE